LFCRFAEKPNNTDEARVFASDKKIVGVTTDRRDRDGIKIRFGYFVKTINRVE
jgi:hypothetical protein